ncbi:MAG: hypothetical protein JXB47_18215 [Anaerolineae bacterium]|nr:hypothetical protein [Anaerolineae bacterium]
MNPSEVMPLFGEVVQAAAEHYRQFTRAKIQEAALEPPQWNLLAISKDFEPETSSVEKMRRVTPYAAASAFEERFKAAVERGLFESVGDGEYKITGEGCAVFDAVYGVFGAKLAELSAQEPIPAADMERINVLLRRLVDASLDAPEPPDKTRLIYNRRSDPGPEISAMYRMLQNLADLNAFRDDAHFAAWKPSGVAGQVWEALTFVWRGDAHTAEELAEKLPFRGYGADDYAAALQVLAEKGWVEAVDGKYRITGQGKALREEAEETTDRCYFAPWAVLGEAEVEELGGLLTRLRDRLAKEPA